MNFWFCLLILNAKNFSPLLLILPCYGNFLPCIFRKNLYRTLSFSKRTFLFPKGFLVSVHTFCTENGFLPGAVISRRKRNGSILFSNSKESTPVGKSDRRFGARPHGWSFTWINARAETTLLSLMQWRTLCFWAFRRIYDGGIHAVCLTWTRAYTRE